MSSLHILISPPGDFRTEFTTGAFYEVSICHMSSLSFTLNLIHSFTLLVKLTSYFGTVIFIIVSITSFLVACTKSDQINPQCQDIFSIAFFNIIIPIMTTPPKWSPPCSFSHYLWVHDLGKQST